MASGAASVFGSQPQASTVMFTPEDVKAFIHKQRLQSVASLGALAVNGNKDARAPLFLIAQETQEPNVEVRKEAVKLIGHMIAKGDAEACVRCCESLKDTSPEVKVLAVQALGKLGPTASPDNHLSEDAAWKIAKLLEDPMPEVRGQAAQTLGDLHPRAQVVARLDTLSKEDPACDVKDLALQALTKLRSHDGVGAIALLPDQAAQDGAVPREKTWYSGKVSFAAALAKPIPYVGSMMNAVEVIVQKAEANKEIAEFSKKLGVWLVALGRIFKGSDLPLDDEMRNNVEKCIATMGNLIDEHLKLGTFKQTLVASSLIEQLDTIFARMQEWLKLVELDFGTQTFSVSLDTSKKISSIKDDLSKFCTRTDATEADVREKFTSLSGEMSKIWEQQKDLTRSTTEEMRQAVEAKADAQVAHVEARFDEQAALVQTLVQNLVDLQQKNNQDMSQHEHAPPAMQALQQELQQALQQAREQAVQQESERAEAIQQTVEQAEQRSNSQAENHEQALARRELEHQQELQQAEFAAEERAAKQEVDYLQALEQAAAQRERAEKLEQTLARRELQHQQELQQAELAAEKRAVKQEQAYEEKDALIVVVEALVVDEAETRTAEAQAETKRVIEDRKIEQMAQEQKLSQMAEELRSHSEALTARDAEIASLQQAALSSVGQPLDHFGTPWDAMKVVAQQMPLFGRPTPTPSPTAAQAAKVSRMGSSGQSLDTSGLGPPTRAGGSSQVVRTSSGQTVLWGPGASGFSQDQWDEFQSSFAAPAAAAAPFAVVTEASDPAPRADASLTTGHMEWGAQQNLLLQAFHRRKQLD